MSSLWLECDAQRLVILSSSLKSTPVAHAVPAFYRQVAGPGGRGPGAGGPSLSRASHIPRRLLGGPATWRAGLTSGPGCLRFRLGPSDQDLGHDGL